MLIRAGKVLAAMLFLVQLFLHFPGTSAAENHRGPAFTDPDITQPMDAAWIGQSLSYDAADGDADLVVVLNQQFYEFMLPYIEQYASERKLKIAVKRGTCGLTAGVLTKKMGDIGAFCCPPTKTDRLPGLKFHTVGIHPVAIMVHPDNPIGELSLEKVRAVFKGEIRRWSELGWSDTPISVVIRPHCKNRPGHWRLLLDSEELFSPDASSVGAIEDVFSLVSSTPGAIGYEVLWMSLLQQKAVKVLKIDGHAPDDTEYLLAGRYPVYRTLLLTTWDDEHLKNPIADDLVRYIIDQTEEHGASQGIVPAVKLRETGWQFRGDELVGEPLSQE